MIKDLKYDFFYFDLFFFGIWNFLNEIYSRIATLWGFAKLIGGPVSSGYR